MSEIRVNNVIADNGLDAVNFTKGINVSSGIVTATSFSGSGDTNTKITFPAADTITAETGGTERLRIASDGKITVAANSDIRFTNGTWTGEVAGKIQQNSNNLYIQGGTGGIRFRHASSGVNQFSMTNGGNFEITNGDVVVASGHGIDFSATASNAGRTTTQELLDDYEEGTFDPILQGGSNGYRFQYGYYVKIGAAVHFTAFIEVSATPPSSNIAIGGLPFTSLNVNNANAYVFPMLTNRTGFGSSGQMNARFYMATNDTFATLYYPVNSSSSNFTTVNADNMNAANASNIWMSGTYFTAS